MSVALLPLTLSLALLVTVLLLADFDPVVLADLLAFAGVVALLVPVLFSGEASTCSTVFSALVLALLAG